MESRLHALQQESTQKYEQMTLELGLKQGELEKNLSQIQTERDQLQHQVKQTKEDSEKSLEEYKESTKVNEKKNLQLVRILFYPSKEYSCRPGIDQGSQKAGNAS